MYGIADQYDPYKTNKNIINYTKLWIMYSSLSISTVFSNFTNNLIIIKIMTIRYVIFIFIFIFRYFKRVTSKVDYCHYH
ncbi:hypothetical protein ABW09_22485 [Pluralibacter gergoviae]|nr:hypothetical protein ABW09_22485 [Pluralibacter gergoviae]